MFSQCLDNTNKKNFSINSSFPNSRLLPAKKKQAQFINFNKTENNSNLSINEEKYYIPKQSTKKLEIKNRNDVVKNPTQSLLDILEEREEDLQVKKASLKLATSCLLKLRKKPKKA